MFKKLFWIHLFIAGFGLFFAPQTLNATSSNEAILNDLNKEWIHKTDVFDANIDLASLTEIERIQSHLATVAKHLEANFSEELSKEQLANRAKALDILKVYANQQCFPQNYYLKHRQPVFIDEHNTVCAVGHLMRETGFATITEKIQREYNYGLIRELLVYPELSAWANEFGFSIEELAWVQPFYGLTLIDDSIQADSAIISYNPFYNDFPYGYPGPYLIVIADSGAGQLSIVDNSPPNYMGYPDIKLTYLPGDCNIQFDTLSYTVTDSLGNLIINDTAKIFITIPPNPIVNYDHDTINIGSSSSRQVLLNDYDPGPNPIYVNLLSPLTISPSNGMPSFLFATNEFTYTPNPTFTGNDTIGYMVCDSCNNCTESFYIITVADTANTPPIAVDDCDSTFINTALIIDVQANDIDFQGDTFFTIQAGGILPSNGLVNTLANDSMQYIPNAGFVGLDSFTYVICEYGLFTNCDTALVKIEVLFQNAAPMVRDTFGNNVDTLYVVMLEDSTNILCVNYFDSNNDTSSVQLINDALGVSTIANDTCIQFTPPNNFNGQTLSQYVLCDNDPMFPLCDTFFVYYMVVPINDLPAFANASGLPTSIFNFTMLEDGLLDTCFNFLSFDSGDVLQLTSFFGVNNGSLVITNDSCIRYQPNANYNGLETFSLIVCDAGITGSCDTALIQITVNPINDKPEFTRANGSLTSTYSATIDEDDVYNRCFNYVDVDGPMVELVTANAQTGSTTTSDTCLTYTPPVNWFGNDTVLLIICDNGSPQLCDTAELYIVVNSVNDAPNAIADKDTTPLNIPITIDVIANDTDVEGDALSLTNVSATSSGGTINQMGNSILFTPDNNFAGIFTYDYTVCDNGTPNKCSTGTGTICISFMNDNPIAVNDTVSTFFGNSINIPVKINDFDSVFANLTVTITTSPFNGSALVNPNGSIDYIPNNGYAGMEQFVYQICDEAPNQLCDEATVFIEVFTLQPKNSFSPNGDGQNDVYEIRGIENFSNNSLMIINRWGDVVFEQAPYDNTWQGGNKNDNPLPDGNYYYLLDLGDGSEIKKGSLLILR